MNMKKTLFMILMVLATAWSASSQVRIPHTRVSFQFPQGGWKYQNTFKIDNNTNVYLYVYTASTVTDNSGDTILPFVRIYVKKEVKEDIYSIAYNRFVQQPFQSLDEYTEGIPQPGLGYVGAYTSITDNKDYQFRMIYFKDGNTALEFRAETTRDTFSAFDELFDEILKTVKVSKK